jgi:AcrR family transcriptional regulator
MLNMKKAESRRAAITDAAILIIARSGLRGLTHRAVDFEAGLSPGTTSYYFRSRHALLAGTLARLAAFDEAQLLSEPRATRAATSSKARNLRDVAEAAGHQLRIDEIAASIADVWAQLLSSGIEHVRARLELALEAARQPDLGQGLQKHHEHFLASTEALLAAAGSTDPERHSQQLVAYLDGILLSHITAARNHPADVRAIQAAVGDLLHGMLDTTQAPRSRSARRT